LRRIFFLPASAETVRQTLKKEGLVESPPKPRRNLTRPRFFERATPNQMWQTDIFTFRLGGKYAYLIGFMDDYSRSRVNLAKGEALSPRLQALLSNRQKMLNTRKISTRLEQIQLARKEEVAAKPQ
jgi:transposase InsO family protein